MVMAIDTREVSLPPWNYLSAATQQADDAINPRLGMGYESDDEEQASEHEERIDQLESTPAPQRHSDAVMRHKTQLPTSNGDVSSFMKATELRTTMTQRPGVNISAASVMPISASQRPRAGGSATVTSQTRSDAPPVAGVDMAAHVADQINNQVSSRKHQTFGSNSQAQNLSTQPTLPTRSTLSGVITQPKHYKLKLHKLDKSKTTIQPGPKRPTNSNMVINKFVHGSSGPIAGPSHTRSQQSTGTGIPSMQNLNSASVSNTAISQRQVLSVKRPLPSRPVAPLTQGKPSNAPNAHAGAVSKSMPAPLPAPSSQNPKDVDRPVPSRPISTLVRDPTRRQTLQVNSSLSTSTSTSIPTPIPTSASASTSASILRDIVQTSALGKRKRGTETITNSSTEAGVGTGCVDEWSAAGETRSVMAETVSGERAEPPTTLVPVPVPRLHPANVNTSDRNTTNIENETSNGQTTPIQDAPLTPTNDKISSIAPIDADISVDSDLSSSSHPFRVSQPEVEASRTWNQSPDPNISKSTPDQEQDESMNSISDSDASSDSTDAPPPVDVYLRQEKEQRATQSQQGTSKNKWKWKGKGKEGPRGYNLMPAPPVPKCSKSTKPLKSSPVSPAFPSSSSSSKSPKQTTSVVDIIELSSDDDQHKDRPPPRKRRRTVPVPMDLEVIDISDDEDMTAAATSTQAFMSSQSQREGQSGRFLGLGTEQNAILLDSNEGDGDGLDLPSLLDTPVLQPSSPSQICEPRVQVCDQDQPYSMWPHDYPKTTGALSPTTQRRTKTPPQPQSKSPQTTVRPRPKPRALFLRSSSEQEQDAVPPSKSMNEDSESEAQALRRVETSSGPATRTGVEFMTTEAGSSTLRPGPVDADVEMYDLDVESSSRHPRPSATLPTPPKSISPQNEYVEPAVTNIVSSNDPVSQSEPNVLQSSLPIKMSIKPSAQIYNSRVLTPPPSLEDLAPGRTPLAEPPAEAENISSGPGFCSSSAIATTSTIYSEGRSLTVSTSAGGQGEAESSGSALSPLRTPQVNRTMTSSPGRTVGAATVSTPRSSLRSIGILAPSPSPSSLPVKTRRKKVSLLFKEQISTGPPPPTKDDVALSSSPSAPVSQSPSAIRPSTPASLLVVCPPASISPSEAASISAPPPPSLSPTTATVTAPEAHQCRSRKRSLTHHFFQGAIDLYGLNLQDVSPSVSGFTCLRSARNPRVTSSRPTLASPNPPFTCSPNLTPVPNADMDASILHRRFASVSINGDQSQAEDQFQSMGRDLSEPLHESGVVSGGTESTVSTDNTDMDEDDDDLDNMTLEYPDDL